MKKVIILLLIILTSCISNSDIDITKHPRIVTVKALADIYDIKVNKLLETSKINKYIDGSVELEYEYDLTEDSNYTPLFYSVTIEKCISVREAKKSYNIELGSLKLVGNSFGQENKPITSLNLPGDDSFYAITTYEDEPVGMLYMTRKGKVIYTIILSGLYTPDHSFITDVILPKISNLEKFELKK